MLLNNKFLKWLLFCLFWALIGLFFVFQSFTYYTNTKQPYDWVQNISYRIPPYLLWALLIPLIYKLALKFKFEKGSTVKSILVHLLFGIPVSVFHRYLSIVISFIIMDFTGKIQGTFAQALGRTKIAVIGGSFDSFFMYCIIVAVIYTFDYYKKYRENQLQSSELQAKLAEAELNSLKMQLQPHFLFNTLHTISALMHKDIEAADKMLARLSDLLRISLDNIGVQEVPLKKELEFLNQYLEIQKIRFQDRLVVEKNISPDTFDLTIPNLILQPIVENAIKYGIEPLSKRGKLSISSFRNGGKLDIIVEDDGRGIKDNFIEGIGLTNTRARLKQLYGALHKFEFTNKQSGGLKVLIEIPVKEYE